MGPPSGDDAGIEGEKGKPEARKKFIAIEKLPEVSCRGGPVMVRPVAGILLRIKCEPVAEDEICSLTCNEIADFCYISSTGQYR